jgi:outer membrane protein assembly factor BamB
MLSRLIVAFAAVCLAAPAFADDWPQWMGPRRDSVWRETGIIDAIPKTGLPVKWRVPVSWGYTGPAVAGGKVFVMDYVIETGELANNPGGRNRLTGQERVLCFDARSGAPVWERAYSQAYNISYAGGPRCTPTVDDDRVYALGAEGRLLCLKANSGDIVWSKDLKQEYGTESPFWGFSAHPLVDGNKLLCVVGGQGSVAVAFDKLTGRELWRALSAPSAGYCPPTIIEAGGARQLLIWDPENLNSLNPETGKVHWSVPLKPDFGMSCTAPRVSGDLLYASGIRTTAVTLRLGEDRPAAAEVWRGESRRGVFCSNSTPFLEEGTIYGVGCNQGELAAVDLATGKGLWQTFAATTGDRNAGHATAFLVKHGDRFFLFNDQGDLILATLTREKYEELGRFHVLEPTNEGLGRSVVWSHPAFANKCLYARNDKELVCVSLAKE